MVRTDFAERAHHEHLALVRALLEACAWCDAPENQDRVISILAKPEYVNAPVEALRMSMRGRYDFGRGRIEDCPGFNLFARDDANVPTPSKAAWVLDGFVRTGLITREALPTDLAAQCFRADLHAEARAPLTHPQPNAA
jgi:ABC-type nitrate/sulfonate/bicarbonate transport system substrate-binding protein